MMIFGPLSSIYDFLTFFILLKIYHASPEFFHTGWFLESLLTQTLVIHVIRTEKIPFIESKPSLFLVFTSVVIVTLGFLVPSSPFSQPFGFVSPPLSYYAVLVLITVLYL